MRSRRISSSVNRRSSLLNPLNVGICLECKKTGIRTEKQFFENQLINYKQAAQYLSVSEVYLRKLKARGKIPYVPLGDRGVRFRVKSLNEWVEKREIG